jgi:hypothetical protein
MTRILHLDLHVGSVIRVHSTFIFEFPTGTHKMEVMLKLYDSTTGIGKIPAGEKGVSKI